MTKVLLKLLPVLLLAVFATAAPALAQKCDAAPGTAAIDEYCENVPSATGDGGGGSKGASGPKVPASTVRALERSGRNGKALSRLLGADVAAAQGRSGSTAPSSPKPSSSSKAGAGKPAANAPKAPSSNPLGAVQSAVGSGATVGSGFVWILIAATLLMAGVAWMRYRRRSTS